MMIAWFRRLICRWWGHAPYDVVVNRRGGQLAVYCPRCRLVLAGEGWLDECLVERF